MYIQQIQNMEKVVSVSSRSTTAESPAVQMFNEGTYTSTHTFTHTYLYVYVWFPAFVTRPGCHWSPWQQNMKLREVEEAKQYKLKKSINLYTFPYCPHIPLAVLFQRLCLHKTSSAVAVVAAGLSLMTDWPYAQSFLSLSVYAAVRLLDE